MRAQAIAKRSHADIDYRAGRSDAIPLAGDTCGAAWLSTVVHHFGDLTEAALELRRVLRPNSPLLIREGFTGRTAGIPWLRYFPDALAVTERFWPTVDAVTDAFAPAGFRFEALRPVEQITARNLREYTDLVRVRADSTLIQLTEEQFMAGIERLELGGVLAQPEPRCGSRGGRDGPRHTAVSSGPWARAQSAGPPLSTVTSRRPARARRLAPVIARSPCAHITASGPTDGSAPTSSPSSTLTAPGTCPDAYSFA
jgi:hypothetical protein